MNNRTYLKMMKIGSDLQENTDNYPEIRIALLNDNAAQQLTKVLKASVLAKNFFPSVYEGEYNTIPLDVFNPDSDLYAFSPEYVWLNLSVQGFRERFYNTGPEEKASLPGNYVNELKSYINTLTGRGCKVILNNLSIPRERFFGNYSAGTPASMYGNVLETNHLIGELVRGTAGCYLNDITYISANIGLESWFDEKLWALYKYMCAPRFFPRITESVAGIIGVTKGKLTKCLVLDLDNTLWGGVIGDDGIDGIEIGELGIGEVYEQFQKYLLELKNRGYILAVCSKNDHDNAVLPFKEHPDMVLKEEDIAVFVANWNNKGSNIKYIAKTLNIGLDSLVFIDDSPFERNQVRDMLPEVIVPEIPEDPSDFIPFLENSDLFETAAFSKDDRKRAEMYRVQSLRAQEELKFESIGDYLKSLNMKIKISRFDSFHLPRIAQLLQRSNQFNLRTQRFTEQNCQDFRLNEDKYYPLYIKLEDKFGDYGLISVICAERKGDTLEILEYVMSCRVLERGVELFALNHLVDYCKLKGLKKIHGEYIPTRKNKLVKNFYRQFGFAVTAECNGVLSWELETGNYQYKQTFFAE